MPGRARGKESLLTPGGFGVEFGNGPRPQRASNPYPALPHPLLPRCGRDVAGPRPRRPCGRELRAGGLRHAPGPSCHHGQQDFARALGGAPDQARAPRAGFKLGGRNKLGSLLHYAEPRFGPRSRLPVVGS